MTTYYIDGVGGNNGWAGTAPGTAWLDETNINSYFAAGTFNAGDSILFFANQTHSLVNIRVRNSSGTLGNPITFGPYYGGSIGTVPVLQKSAAGTYAWIIGKLASDSAGNYIRIEGLRLDCNALCSSSGKGIVWIDGATNWELDRLEIFDTGNHTFANGVKCRGDGSVVITRCNIHDCYEEGVYGGTAGDSTDNSVVEMYDSMVWNCQGEGVDLKDGTINAIVKRCVISNCGDGGGGVADRQLITMGGDGHLIEDCRLYGPNATDGILTGVYGSTGTLTINRCLVDGPTNGIHFSGAGAINNVSNCTVVNNTYSLYQGGATNNVTTTICRNYVTGYLFGGPLNTDDTFTADPSFITPIGPVPYVTRKNDGVAEGYGWWESR